ncbi:MAG: Ribonuclease H [Parcubacteria group bacterium GW2011_GWC2_38_7]|nr:MAG: Ribonuclease H [Parcubacteria group bacterium GW2011_GWC2_38_7]
MKLKIHSDGGARGNPGPSAIGYVIQTAQDKVIFKVGECIGHKTNNEAEYAAIIAALKKAKELGGTELDCYLDSELVVKQLRGEYKVRDEKLSRCYLMVWSLQNQFKLVKYHHIYREKNTLADSLVNEALDRK